jgi:HD superfamily phosphodiesterase
VTKYRNAATEIAGLARALDLKLLDSALVRATNEHAGEISDPWLFNHVVHSWLFAAALAQAQQLKHDAELLAASRLLHDIGLTAAFRGEVRFEVFGANAARDFVARHGVDARSQQITSNRDRHREIAQILRS